MMQQNINDPSLSNLPNSQLWKLSLFQLLQLHQQANIYPLALSKSRQQQQSLTPQLANILQLLVNNDDKWLQVVRKLIKNNYQNGFQFGRNIDKFIIPLIAQFYTHNHSQQNKVIYSQQLWEIIQKSVQIFDKINDNQKYTIITILNTYLQNILNYKDQDKQQSIFMLLANNNNVILTILKYGNLQNYINNNNYAESNKRIWEIHNICVQFIIYFMRLLQNIQNKSVRKLNVRRFRHLLGLDSSERNDYGIYGIIDSYISKILQYLNEMNKINNKQQTTNIFSNNLNKYNNNNNNNIQSTTFIQFFKTQHENKLIQYHTNLILVLMQLSKISAFQAILSKNQFYLTTLADILKNINILQLNKYQNINTQLLALNSQISYQIFSDTLSGTTLHTIICLCNNIGAFFHHFYTMLYKIYKTGQIMKLQSKQFISYILKVNLLANHSVMLYRQEQIQELVLGLTKFFVEKWENFREIQQIQILRFFMIFVGINKNQNKMQNIGLGVTHSAQQLIQKCMKLCFQFLCNNSNMQIQISNQNELTPIQQQCLDILKSLPKSSNTLRIIKSSLLETLINIFMNLPNNSLVYFELVNQYIKCVPQLVTRSSSKLLSYYCQAFQRQTQQFERKQRYNNKSQSTQKIYKILHNIEQILRAENQIQFQDIQQKVVIPILSKLLDNKNNNYEEQVLSILQVLLVKHKYFTQQICRILSKLPQLYQKNNYKLSLFSNIYSALSHSPQIVRQVIYEFPDLILLMLQMFSDYLNRSNPEQFCFYKEQVTKLLWNVQSFIQIYQIRIIEDNDMLGVMRHIFKGAQSAIIFVRNFFQKQQIQMNRNINHSLIRNESLIQFYELLLQLMFTISHMCIDPKASQFNRQMIKETVYIIKQTPIRNYKYLQTIKMIPIIFIDQLMIFSQNHQQVMKDIFSYCDGVIKLEMEGGMNKKWEKIQNFKDWKNWEVRTKVYIQNTLRELRNRRQIDQADWSQYTKILDKLL